MAPCVIRMPSDVSQSQKAMWFWGVVSPRRVQDDSSVQGVWPIKEGNLDCHRSCPELREHGEAASGLVWIDN